MQPRYMVFVASLLCVGGAFIGLDAMPAAAEIVNCNGVLTNQPCKNATPVMKELKTSPEEQQAAQQRSAKRTRAQHYAIRAIKAQRELGVASDIASVENYCAMDSTSYESCDDRVRLQEADLDRQTAAVRAQRERERAAVQRQEQAEQTANQQVVVIQNNDVWERRRDWYRPRPGWHDGSRDHPYHGDEWRPDRPDDRPPRGDGGNWPPSSGGPRPGGGPGRDPGRGPGDGPSGRPDQPDPGRSQGGLTSYGLGTHK